MTESMRLLPFYLKQVILLRVSPVFLPLTMWALHVIQISISLCPLGLLAKSAEFLGGILCNELVCKSVTLLF